MADIYIVKERLKLLLALVGVSLVVATVVTLKFHSELVTAEDNPQFIFAALVTGALALAWVSMLILFFVFHKIMRTSESLIGLLDSIPWRSIGVALLIVVVAGLGVGIYRYSGLVTTPLDLLRSGEMDQLKEAVTADPSILDKQSGLEEKNLLETAYNENMLDAMELLLSEGAAFGPTFVEEYNPVLVSLSNPSMLRLLMDAGLSANGIEGGEAPLMQAAHNGLTNSVAILLEAGADVDVRDSRFRTPLIHSVELEDYPMVKLLLDGGADVNAWDRGGETALHQAVKRRNSEIALLLMQYGAIPSLFDFRNNCPIHLAAASGQNDLVELFLANPDLNKLRDKSDRTALEHALLSKKYDTARLLLRHGAKINRIMANGYTPAHDMAVSEKYDIVRFLIEEGVDLHIPGPSGETLFGYIKRKKIASLLELTDTMDEPAETPAPGTKEAAGNTAGLILLR